ncbi:amidohydrolase family protein [candidate division KSB1 bacterium]|nr:amidohydrolase family protein [candidate division KSB1 bacterium]
MKIVDVNVSIGNWPFQRFPYYDLQALSTALDAEGVSLAVVTAVEAILNSDPCYNQNLHKQCQNDRKFVFLPVVDPSMPGWEERLSAFLPGLRGVKIFPNYHTFALGSSQIRDLILFLKALTLPLIIQMRVDDERNQHPHMRVAGVAVEDITQLANLYPDQVIVCLNAYIQEVEQLLQNSENIYADISFCEHMDTLGTLNKTLAAERLLFGSHTPFLYTRSATMKLNLSRISKEMRQKIAWKNAEDIFRLEEL